MASKVLMPGLNMNHVAFHGDNDQPKHSHSFGQVCLPNKTGISSSRRSVIANNNSVATPAAVMCSSVVSKTTSILSGFWREFQGCNDWENMVEPLHPVLRKEIIRYGEFVAACYKVFDLDPNSKRYLNCKYGKRSMLNEVGLGNSGYEVTKYIYATPDVSIPIQNGASCGRWIGYVAVSSDETVKKLGRRDVLVTFRGTVTNHEWVSNFMSSLTTARLDPHNPRAEVKVESGFLSLYTSDETDSKFKLESCREQLLSEVSRLLNKYKHEDLSITLAGHSMGSALALLLAYDITELGLNKTDLTETKPPVPVTVFSFGGPRVGNSSFKQRCEELGVKVLRIVNVNDPITKLPGVLFNENFRGLGGRYEFPWSCSCYAHVGVELAMDFFNMHNPSFVHDLEAYISLLKCPKTKRVEQRKNIIDVDLLNKARDFILSAQNFNMNLPWKDAAINIVNMVQSQKT